MAKQLIGLIKPDPQYRGGLTKAPSLRGTFKVAKEHDTYLGSYLVIPKANKKQVLRTQDRIMKEDVTVLEVPYYEVSNDQNGTTVYIAKEV